jgi:hypothetical protein
MHFEFANQKPFEKFSLFFKEIFISKHFTFSPFGKIFFFGKTKTCLKNTPLWQILSDFENSSLLQILLIWKNSPFLQNFIRESSLNTTGIRGFAECGLLCRVPFVGHSAKTALPSAALGTVRHSANRALPRAEHSAPNGTRQRQLCRVSNTRQRGLSANGRQRPSQS